jgi:hypothetical protein
MWTRNDIGVSDGALRRPVGVAASGGMRLSAIRARCVAIPCGYHKR